MPEIYACPKGHRWEGEAGPSAAVETGSTTCPYCGETAVQTATAPEDAETLDASTQRAAPFVSSTAEPDAAAATSTGAAAGELPEIPGYEMLGPIAQGGMGSVFKARHATLQRLVAIKVPLVKRVAGETNRKRFLREARSAARLRHPNICTIHEVGEQAGGPYIVMDYIEGQTLRQWAKQRHPSARQAAEMTAKLARAAAYAHEHGVIHRDIKPSNVMVDRETGEPVLMDFGLAKETTGDDSLATQTGDVLGTPTYMAPEQAAGHSERVGTHSDVYALGAVLYDLLCGRPPFEGNVGEILRQVQTDEPVSPRKRVRRIHRDLETICLKALAKEPQRRYASASELAEDLERFSAGESILARREAAPVKLLRAARRNPVAAWSIAAAVLLLPALAHFAIRADRNRRLAEIREQFEVGLDASQWSADELAQAERLVSELGRLDAQQGEGARARLIGRLAESIEERIYRPNAQEPQTRAGIESALILLASRDSAAAERLRQQLDTRLRTPQTVFSLAAPFNTVGEVFDLTDVEAKSGSLVLVGDARDAVRTIVTKVPCEGSAELLAEFAGESWLQASRVGLGLDVRNRGLEGFRFLITAAQQDGTGGEAGAEKQSLRSVLQKLGAVDLAIERDGVRITQQRARLPMGPLRLRVKREGDQIEFQVNNLEPIKFRDVFQSRPPGAGFFAVLWPTGARLETLRATEQALPATPSPLEQGDFEFSYNRFDAALDQYRAQQIDSNTAEVRLEARCKEALCLLELNQSDDAVQILEEVAGNSGERWPLVAACRLWAIHLQRKDLESAEVIFQRLKASYTFSQLAALVPQVVRNQIADAYGPPISPVSMSEFNAHRARDVERRLQVRSLVLGRVPLYMKLGLLRAYRAAGQLAEARVLAQDVLRHDYRLDPGYDRLSPEGLRYIDIHRTEEYSWLLRELGEADAALAHVDRLLFSQDSVRAGFEALLVERARLHAQMGAWEDVAEDLGRFFAKCAPGDVPYKYYSAAALIHGFLLLRGSGEDVARDAWRKGLYRTWPDQETPIINRSFFGFFHNLALASLSDELTEAESGEAVAQLASRFEMQGRRTFAMALNAIHVLHPMLFRQMWQTPRGREVAQHLALRDVAFGEYTRLPLVLMCYEIGRQGAFGEAVTPEQDVLTWELAEAGYDAFVGSGRLDTTRHGLPILLTWQGHNGRLTWGSVSGSLPGSFRGPLAYLLGRRYLRLPTPKPNDAEGFFRTALADAPADSPLARLAQAELDGLVRE